MSNKQFLGRGLIINAQGIQLSDVVSYSEIQPSDVELCSEQRKNDIKKNTSFHAKLIFSKTKKKSFLLKNYIDLPEDALEHVSQKFGIDEALLIDKSPRNVLFLIIHCSKVERTIDKETVKSIGELICKVKEALKHCDPYHELMDVFNNYGHFLPKKMICGHKLLKMTCLTADISLSEPIEKNWTTLEDFSESKFGDVLDQWENYISISGPSYLDKLKEWIKNCINDNNFGSVICCKELYPLYEIFDLPLHQEIESVLGISDQIESEKVLATGKVLIKNSKNSHYSYSVKFPVPFKSNDYQVFGKFMRGEELIDDVIVKFDFMRTYGFLIFVENEENLENYMFTDVSLQLQIVWILIGIPAKVGYFCENTRKIEILKSGLTKFASELNVSDYSVELEVPKNLSRNSVIVTSFKCPPSNYEPNFIAKLHSSSSTTDKYEDADIDSDEPEHKESSDCEKKLSERTKVIESEYSIQWYILRCPNEIDSPKMIYLNKIGQELGNQLSKIGQKKLENRLDKYFLTDISKIDIEDADLHIVVINALKNVLKICVHYGMNKDGSDESNKFVNKHVDFIGRIKKHRRPNDYIINIVNKYYKEIKDLDIYEDKPLLKQIIDNVNVLFEEITIQDKIRNYINHLDNELYNLHNLCNTLSSLLKYTSGFPKLITDIENYQRPNEIFENIDEVDDEIIEDSLKYKPGIWNVLEN
ncbi:6889_t:CDS:2 [Gigaspora margarita]|uniref:6889_t:CDS:1 n=1 Tax=Gigaspora margarita TaxID=4874 RepID=A0ABM8VY19_GIGMA|nr:6889_t:CDS:2 [Gigaspora margarita]